MFLKMSKGGEKPTKMHLFLFCFRCMKKRSGCYKK